MEPRLLGATINQTKKRSTQRRVLYGNGMEIRHRNVVNFRVVGLWRNGMNKKRWSVAWILIQVRVRLVLRLIRIVGRLLLVIVIVTGVIGVLMVIGRVIWTIITGEKTVLGRRVLLVVIPMVGIFLT